MATLRLVWSERASRDVNRLWDFLADKSPLAAERATRRILDAAKVVAVHPAAGTRRDLPRGVAGGYRQVVVRFGAGAYVLGYRTYPDFVLILRVWHSRERRPR